MRRHALVAAGLAVLLVVAGCAGGPAASNSSTDDGAESTIRVAGAGSAEAEPNEVIIDVAVVTTATEASTARRKLAENTTRMREALSEVGVSDDQIRTQHYDIRRDRRRPPEKGEEPRVRYRAAHDFEVTLTETDAVGRVIDTAVENGATQVGRIEFTLSTDRRRQLEDEAREAAMTDARQKARGLAATSNLTITGVRVVQTGGGAPRPGGDGAATETAMATPGPGAGSEIESGPVTVVTTVQVVYTAEPTGDGEAES